MFKTKFGLDCTVQKLSKGKGNSPKDKYSLYIKVASLPRLRELVVPYMHPSMLYKLGFGARAARAESVPGSAGPGF